MSNQTRTDKIYLEGRGYTNLTILTLSFCFICLPSIYLTINKIKKGINKEEKDKIKFKKQFCF